MNTLLRLTEFKNRLVRDWNLMVREGAFIVFIGLLCIFLTLLGIDGMFWAMLIVTGFTLYVEYRASKVIAKYDRMDFELNEMLRDK